jgi:hypothetical protein
VDVEAQMKSFKAYPSGIGAHYPCYARSIPLKCDKVEWDDFGTFDTVNFCFVAPEAMTMEFYANLQWKNPPTGSVVKVLFMKNQLGTLQGAAGGEFGGTNFPVYNPNSDNPSVTCTQVIKLNAGDKVWAVPCAVNSGGLYLTQASAGNGQVTVNYFIGKQL